MSFKNSSITGRLSMILAIAGVIWVIGHELAHYLPDLESWIDSMEAFAPLGFILIFAVLTPVFVSVDMLCFAAGLLFSIGVGELCIIIATYLASALIFLLGRYLLKDKVDAFISRHRPLAALDSAINHQPFKLMFLLRLTPLPFAMLGYALAVTEVAFLPYLGATSGILLYNTSLVYLGYTTKQLAGLAGGPARQGEVSYPLLVLGAVISLLVLIYVAKTAGATLNRLNLEKGGPSC